MGGLDCVHLKQCREEKTECGGLLLPGVCRGDMVMGLFHTPTLTVFQMMSKVARLLVVSTLVMVIVGPFKDMRSELSQSAGSQK